MNILSLLSVTLLLTDAYIYMYDIGTLSIEISIMTAMKMHYDCILANGLASHHVTHESSRSVIWLGCG